MHCGISYHCSKYFLPFSTRYGVEARWCHNRRIIGAKKKKKIFVFLETIKHCFYNHFGIHFLLQQTLAYAFWSMCHILWQLFLYLRLSPKYLVFQTLHKLASANSTDLTCHYISYPKCSQNAWNRCLFNTLAIMLHCVFNIPYLTMSQNYSYLFFRGWLKYHFLRKCFMTTCNLT